MKSNDILQKHADLRSNLQKAIKDNDETAFAQAFDDMIKCIGEELNGNVQQKFAEMRDENDRQVLIARGVRQLTNDEKKYYQELIKAMLANDPRQALANLPVIMPETIIDSVMSELQEEHELLSRLDFVNTGAAIKMVMDTNGHQEAVWGELCDSIVKEIASGFKVVNTTLFKLSAFLPVCKEALDLGPEWLDRYVRTILYEAIANGAEVGFVDGTGNNQPIGMTRCVDEGVTVTGGVYPRKAKIKVNNLDIYTMGRLFGMLAVDANGKQRKIHGAILLVNPVDYYSKVLPAITIMAPDGTYRSTLPFMSIDDVIQTTGVAVGEAVIGLPSRYAGFIGTPKEGVIDFSDHAQFVQDKRVYIAKLLANGMPKDNNSFLTLDISDLEAPIYKVESVSASTASSNANLAGITLGKAALSATFAAGTTTYTATTTAATAAISATPEEISANVKIKLTNTTTGAGGAFINNGDRVTWDVGENTVAFIVTAENGSTTKTYTVTVTKS